MIDDTCKCERCPCCGKLVAKPEPSTPPKIVPNYPWREMWRPTIDPVVVGPWQWWDVPQC